MNELNRKAMVLGNKLAPRMDGDRKIAFVEAWAIVKAQGLTLPVKGVTQGTRQEALRRLASYRAEQVKAFIVPEPENPADPAALAVMVMVMVNGGRGVYRLGYIPRNQTAAVKALGQKTPGGVRDMGLHPQNDLRRPAGAGRLRGKSGGPAGLPWGGRMAFPISNKRRKAWNWYIRRKRKKTSTIWPIVRCLSAQLWHWQRRLKNQT
ncbi:hypothetical protein FACS189468_8920 [Spirochaetia bacterium]|nr:hypothetical protein FACS189468_8920 [Spirochaetia bacterium]